MVSKENSLLLAGQILDTPVFSHQTHNTSFMRFTLSIKRLSGVCDNIIVLARSELVTELSLKACDFVKIIGELRSFNNKSGIGNRLLVSAFAHEISHCFEEYQNELQLSGVLCKDANYRMTPLGREICDLMLAINRKYGRSDYLPCIVWGKNAAFARNLKTGTYISLSGRIQSREYIKLCETKTTYEVSVSEIYLP